LAGYVAKDYVVNGKTTARVNLRRTPSGTVIKVLPAGTAVKEYPEEQEIVNGILWIYCEVI
jgi:hypothetical protein